MDPARKYRQIWIGLGNGNHSKVYDVEVSEEEYLAYTTEQSEKVELYDIVKRNGGDLESAIKQIAHNKKKN